KPGCVTYTVCGPGAASSAHGTAQDTAPFSSSRRAVEPGFPSTRMVPTMRRRDKRTVRSRPASRVIGSLSVG
ncbi:MAG: hypothetical protein ACK56I_03705, partial [bacterium]